MAVGTRGTGGSRGSRPTHGAHGARSGTFGPSALATPANAVSLGRLVVAPFLLAVIVRDGATWPALAGWILLSSTDGLDGYLARRQGTTRSGAFLDPLADKALVIGAMVALVAIEVFWWVPVALIAAREAVISVYRTWVGRRGVSIPARQWAKVKTVVQDIAVGFALLPLAGDNHAPANAFLWAGVVLALVTGVQYLLDGSKAAHAV